MSPSLPHTYPASLLTILPLPLFSFPYTTWMIANTVVKTMEVADQRLLEMLQENLGSFSLKILGFHERSIVEIIGGQ